MYASYYLCRYNFPIANDAISNEFHLSNTQMGMIISANQISYAVGQMINGLFTDRIFLGIMVIGLLGLITDQLFKLTRNWLLPWAAHP